MKIGVISDTHVRTIEGIPKAILKALETVDLIVHAGDFTEKAVLEALKSIGQVKAVCGNMDSHELKNMLPQTELFTVGEKGIGLVHGAGGPWGIAEEGAKAVPRRARRHFWAFSRTLQPVPSWDSLV